MTARAASPHCDAELVSALLEARESREEGRETPRRYLGASVVGHPCDRYLFLHIRGLLRERFDGRMLRLFDRGRREEAVFVEELRWIGADVRPFAPDGSQWTVEAFGGHIRGHLDAAALLPTGSRPEQGGASPPVEWHVCEFKTHSDKSFRDLQKKGVCEAKPLHWAQMQVYMALTGMTRALYIAVDKDTDELHVERVPFDEAGSDRLLRRARAVVEGHARDRLADRADDWRCRICPAAHLCFPGADAAIFPSDCPPDCRSCRHASPDTDGEGAAWHCALGLAPTIGERTDCRHHVPFPDLLPGVEWIDEDPPRVAVNGATLALGPEPGQYAGPELAAIPRASVVSIEKAKRAFPGATVRDCRGLVEVFTLDGYGVEAWSGPADGLPAALTALGIDPGRVKAREEWKGIDATLYLGPESVEHLVLYDPRNQRGRIMRARF